MLNEISLAKKAALMKIVDSGTVTKGSQPSLFGAGFTGAEVVFFILFSVDFFWIVLGLFLVALESGVLCGSSLFLGFGFARIAPTCHQDRGGGG